MSPILLDLQTLSLVMVLVTAFLTFVMVFVWMTQKTYAGFGLWVISNITVAAGILLLGFGGVWGDLLGTSLTFGAVLIGYEGNRSFLKLKNSLSFTLSIFAFHTAGLLYFKIFNDNIVLQISFTTLIVSIISAICGFIFTQNTAEKTNFSYKFTGITYFSFAFFMIFRSVVTFFTGDKNDFFKPDGIQPLFFILYILFEIIWTFNYVNLNSNRLYNDLEEAQTELEKLATTDFLTGTKNNRSFFEIGENEIQRAKRFHYPLSVIMLDIDFFKSINDDFGHAAGDEVLIEIARICRNGLRGTDTLARLGGEEFAVLLPHTDIKAAISVAEHLRECIEKSDVNFSTNTVKVTASFGVTELKPVDTHIKIMLDRADILLYKAKNEGRNRVISDTKKKIYRELVAA